MSFWLPTHILLLDFSYEDFTSCNITMKNDNSKPSLLVVNALTLTSTQILC